MSHLQALQPIALASLIVISLPCRAEADPVVLHCTIDKTEVKAVGNLGVTHRIVLNERLATAFVTMTRPPQATWNNPGTWNYTVRNPIFEPSRVVIQTPSGKLTLNRVSPLLYSFGSPEYGPGFMSYGSCLLEEQVVPNRLF